MNAALERLAALVRAETGNEVPAGRLPLLAEIGARRVEATGAGDLVRYVEALADRRSAGEWEVLVSLLTIKESSFFRAPQQFERLRETVLPELVAARARERRLRIWSAAAAAGEEAATLALVLAETPALAGWDWTVVATDLDAAALAQAERGLYGERALAQVPEALRAAHFTRRGSLWELSARIRERIVYRRLNLAKPPFRLPEAVYDLVLLRNVLIYFRHELQRAVVAAVASHLAPDGTLFLGASETLWRLHEELETIDLGDCFAYRHPRPGDRPRPRTAMRPLPAAVAPRGAPVAPADGRQAALGGESPEPLPAAADPPHDSPAELLLAAVSLVEAHRLAAAGEAVERLLSADPADPAAHVLGGLLAELEGRESEAADAFRAALYLDPELVQARWRLAACLARLGEAALAERQYREVVAGLERGVFRRLAALEGRLLPDPAAALAAARAALARGRESAQER
ncbi:MAG: CheR family methyltransferase [Thermoanaerobaculia bacterium]